MIIQEIIELDYRVIENDPSKLKENIDMAKERIMRALMQHMDVQVENVLKDGSPIKKIIVTFEP